MPARHPGLVALLAAHEPFATAPITVWGGSTRLQMSGFAGAPDLPDELVLSIRCLVVVGDRLVVCRSADGDVHPWPGGRREAGEAWHETAVREVHEETGWHLDPPSLRQIGWLRFEVLSPAPVPPLGPHPDFLQVVMVGRAVERDGGVDAEWTDVMGQELSSSLMRFDEATAAVHEVERAFIGLVREAGW